MMDLKSYAKAYLAACNPDGMIVRPEDGARPASPLEELYRTQPSAMRFEMRCNKMANVGDIARRFREARRLYYNGEKGLNACAQGFMMRDNGWYLMALIDCIELCSEQLYEHYRALIDIFRESMRGLLRWQDEETGLFCRVIDRPAGEGNAPDLCGSAMAAYAMYKAVRLGVLDEEKYLPIADSVLEGVAGCMPAGMTQETDAAAACRIACSEYLLAGRE